MKKRSFVLRPARGSAKLVVFALAVQEGYGPLERRVFDLQFSGQVSGAVVAFQRLGHASVARAKYVYGMMG